MVLVILLVLALFVLQTLLPGRFREAPPRRGPEQTQLKTWATAITCGP